MRIKKSVEVSHESYPYNRNMAQALYRSTFLESWGSGIHRIIEACQEQGIEEPTWRWDGAFVYVTFKRPLKDSTDNYKKNLGGNVAPSAQESKGERSPEAPSKGESKGERSPEAPSKGESKGERSPEAPSKGESNRGKVITLLSKDGNLTLPEIASELNLSLAGVEKIVRKLKSEGILSRKGSTKAGEWIVTTTIKN